MKNSTATTDKDATSAIVAGEWKFVEGAGHPTWDLWQGKNLAATVILVPQVIVRYCPVIITDGTDTNLTPSLSLREAQIACADYLAMDH